MFILGIVKWRTAISLSSRVVLGGVFLFALSCSSTQSKATPLASSPGLNFGGISQVSATLPSAMGDASHRASWLQYQSGLQALENNDWLEAQYYFDLAMDELVSEIGDSLVVTDSVYFRTMPSRILMALEITYPHLSELGSVDSALAMANDMDLLEEIDDTPIDSGELRELVSFLDTLDLSRFSIPVALNERVMQEIHFLTRSARGFTEGSLSRKTAFEEMIRAKLRARNMPEDLMYLSLVESGFKIKAYSKAKASGLWQFIPATGKRYGLDVDFWVDMRRDPELATEAAMDYLSMLYKDFGDWHLAMAAYNCGEGRIRRLVREAGSDSVSYWDLKLPRETMHYVPRILAAMIIGHFPEHYGFKVESQTRMPFDTVTVDECLPLENAAQAVGVGVNTIRDLNLELNRWCTPPNKKNYKLRIPEGTREQFLTAYAEMDRSKFARWQQYKVRSGDNLARVARKFGLRSDDLRQANSLKGNRLKVGQVLVIPMPAGAMPSSQTFTEAAEPSTAGRSKVYTVRKGDNLGSIARKYGLSIKDLKDWNGLQDSRIRNGQRLALQEPSIKEEIVTRKKTKSGVESSGETYTVRSGDSYYSISNAMGIDQEALMELNDADDSKLQLGRVLKLPNGAVKVAEANVRKQENLATDAKAASYEVRDGDNLYSISRRLGVSLSDLQKWNNLGASTDIHPGQKLLLKDGGNGKSSAAKATGSKNRAPAFYVVRNGDNLWDIARRHSVSVQQISDWNNLGKKKLQPGMRIQVGP